MSGGGSAETLPPLAFRFDSLYAWGFSLVEVAVNIGWTLGFVMLSRTRNRSSEATALTNLSYGSRAAARRHPDRHLQRGREHPGAHDRRRAGMDYPNLRVWMLDDSRRAWLKELCDELGCQLSDAARQCARQGRQHQPRARHTCASIADPPEFVAILDADFVPHPAVPVAHHAAVSATDGRPRADAAAFLQSRPDPDQPARRPMSGPTSSASSSTIVHAVQGRLGRRILLRHLVDHPDCARSRRSAASRPTSVTEDYLVTLRLEGRGCHTVYLNEPLT